VHVDCDCVTVLEGCGLLAEARSLDTHGTAGRFVSDSIVRPECVYQLRRVRLIYICNRVTCACNKVAYLLTFSPFLTATAVSAAGAARRAAPSRRQYSQAHRATMAMR
jgi:hypothetical protein